MQTHTGPGRDVTLTVGHEELRIRGIYEVVSITNDFLAGLLFVVGSIMFLARPAIRLTRRVHLGRISGATRTGESARDF